MASDMAVFKLRMIGGQQDVYLSVVKLNNMTTLSDLKIKIEELTKIPSDFLAIECDGEQLPRVERPLQNLGHGKEIVVYHKLLTEWKRYRRMMDEIRSKTASGYISGRRNIALRARSILSTLMASSFFSVYSNLELEQYDMARRTYFLIHNVQKYFNRSVLAYFTAIHPNQKVKLKKKSKGTAGIHLGVLVLIDDIPTYYAKTLGSIPEPDEEIDFPNGPKVDLLEIFVYFILKYIGIGTDDVHIIPDGNRTELVYIATSLIKGFRTASGVAVSQLMDDSSCEVLNKVVIDKEMKTQMQILSSLFCLSDLLVNKGNHGVVEEQVNEDEKVIQLRIVDFGVNLGREPNLEDSSQQYLEKWNIRTNIYRARETMLNNPALKNNQNLNSKTFDSYFKRVETALATVK